MTTRLLSFLGMFCIICFCVACKSEPKIIHLELSTTDSIFYTEYIIGKSNKVTDTLCALRLGINNKHSTYYEDKKLNIGIEVRRQSQDGGYSYNILYQSLEKKDIK